MLLLALVCPGVSLAQLGGDLDPAIKQELDYARLLNENGFPNFAEEVVKRIKHPDAAILAEVIKIQAYIARGNFDKVISIIGSKPDQAGQKVWALKLSLADGYYAWGRYADAQAIYDDFFKKYPKPTKGLQRFYLESAYKYAQMLILMGKEKESTESYDRALSAIDKDDKEQRHIRRQLQGEKVEVLVKLADKAKGDARNVFMEKAMEIIDGELMWVQDLWFGKAIVMKAHIRMMKDDVKGAQELLDDMKQQLEGIDHSLQVEAQKSGEDLTKLSPMAECRYLIGVMMQAKAEKLSKAGGAKTEIEELLVGKQYREKRGSETIEKRTKGAFQHFINVFIRYPNTAWAPDCGKRAKDIQEQLESLTGKKIQYEIKPEDLEKVQAAQFLQARTLYNQKQFEKAILNYIDVLNLFPEGETSVSALGELAASYIEAQTDPNEMYEFHVNMLMHYLGERFSQNQDLLMKAGDQLLRVAGMYEEREMANRRDEIYDIFFEDFTKHPRAAAMLFMFGAQRLQENDIDGAKSYFERIIKDYSHVPIYTDAMGKLAMCYKESGDRISEIKLLSNLVKTLEAKPRPGYPLVDARFRLATSLKGLSSEYHKKGREPGASNAKYKAAGDKYLVVALKRFQEISAMLEDQGKRKEYFKTAEQEKALDMVLQGALFYEANCYASLSSGDESKDLAYKQKAITICNDLVKRFPESQFAPPALSQIMALYTIIGGADTEITRTAQFLQKHYPKSPEANNADYLLANSLLEMGRRPEAIKAFKRMFEGESGGGFSVSKILTAGAQLLTAEEYEIAQQAFQQVITKATQPQELQPAMLGSGQAFLGTKKYKEAAKVLDKLLEKYPKSGYTVKAALALSTAYSKLAVKEADAGKRRELFDDSIRAMKVMRKYAGQDKPGLRIQSDVEVARVLALKAQSEKDFGAEEEAAKYRKQAASSYQSIIMFAKTGSKEVRPHLENAYAEGGPLLMEVLEKEEDITARIDEYENILIDCNNYFKMFPTGKRISDMRRLRTKANAQVTILKQKQGPDTTTPPAGGEADQANTGK